MIKSLFSLPVYQAGLAGVPDTSVLLDNLGGRVTEYEHTIAATFGFESVRLGLPVDLDEAEAWFNRLGASLFVWDPMAASVWEGLLVQVEYSAGGRTRSVSLDAMSNRIIAQYTNILGEQGLPVSTSNAASIARYGTKDFLLNLGTTNQAEATALAAAYLKRRQQPRAQQQLTVGVGQETGAPVQLMLTFAGWADTLGWVLTSRTDTTNEASNLQVAALIGTVSPGIGATNNFLSTSTALITASGQSVTRYIERNTSYRDKINALVAVGDTSGERIAWGVYEGRRLTYKQWAGATPNTIAYQAQFGSAMVTTPNGLDVPLWLVRPDAMIEELDTVEVRPAGLVDSGNRFYAERVTFRATETEMSLSIEPEASSGLDARVAKIGG